MSVKITSDLKKFILNKTKQLCVPAQGCTEIGAIGYGVAAASSKVKKNIENVKSISVEVSPYIFKNVMRVGVPNLGTCGIHMIVGVAAAIADPSRKLEMFSKVSPQQKSIGEKLHDNGKIIVKIPHKCDPVYVKTTITSSEGTIESIISGTHDNLISLKVNGRNTIKSSKSKVVTSHNKIDEFDIDGLTFEDLIDIAASYNAKDLAFLEDLFKMNMNISKYGMHHLIPNSYSQIYRKSIAGKMSLKQQIIYETATAIDARMNGAVMPVMSSCGSGDHGLTANIPQFTYHKCMKSNRLLFLQSLLLTNLFVWKIKSNIGTLSCMCGSVIAAGCAAIACIAYQMKMSKKQISDLMEMFLCTFNSSMCDGAKLSCTHKICTALLVGLDLIDMLKLGYKVKQYDGIIAGDINKTIKIFQKMSKENSNKYNFSIVNGMCKLESKF